MADKNALTSNERCSHAAGWYRDRCPWCEVERLRVAMGEAYALLTYAAPDSELVDDEPKWMAECDAWMDKFAPSKLSVLSSDSTAPQTDIADKLPRLEFGPFCGCCTRNKVTLGLEPSVQYSPLRSSLVETTGESQRKAAERCTCGQQGCSQCGEDPHAYGFVR